MVSACAIILGGLWSHASSINDRLRAMNRERLELWRASSADAYCTERTVEIDTQVPLLLRRHRRVRDAIVALYVAILLYLASMFAIAGASLLDTPATLALLLFLVATLLLLDGVGLAILEIGISQNALEYEVSRVASLQLTCQQQSET